MPRGGVRLESPASPMRWLLHAPQLVTDPPALDGFFRDWSGDCTSAPVGSLRVPVHSVRRHPGFRAGFEFHQASRGDRSGDRSKTAAAGRGNTLNQVSLRSSNRRKRNVSCSGQRTTRDCRHLARHPMLAVPSLRGPEQSLNERFLLRVADTTAPARSTSRGGGAVRHFGLRAAPPWHPCFSTSCRLRFRRQR
jgi:hypothetical protein